MGTITSRLGQVFFGRTRLQVLAWLFGHPGQAYYLSELKRHTGVGQGALQRELATLTDAGLLERTTRGRHVFFTASANSPVYEELRSILAKTAGAADALRQALAPLVDTIGVAFIYGSVARGDERASSDLDLAVIGEASFGEIVGALSAAQSRLGRDINPSVFPAVEFQRKIRAGHHFLTSLMSEPKIFVIGDEHELAKLAAQRLADDPQVERKRSARPLGRGRPGPARQRDR